MKKRNRAGQKHILEAIPLGSAHVPRPCLWLWPKHRVIQAQRVGVGVQLTLRRRHLFSLMAPRQPRKPVTMTMVPMAMTRLAADSEGKLGEKVAKLPWDTESQIPTPSSPQPQSCRERKAC